MQFSIPIDPLSAGMNMITFLNDSLSVGMAQYLLGEWVNLWNDMLSLMVNILTSRNDTIYMYLGI